jgi:hypothetical protein
VGLSLFSRLSYVDGVECLGWRLRDHRTSRTCVQMTWSSLYTASLISLINLQFEHLSASNPMFSTMTLSLLSSVKSISTRRSHPHLSALLTLVIFAPFRPPRETQLSTIPVFTQPFLFAKRLSADQLASVNATSCGMAKRTLADPTRPNSTTANDRDTVSPLPTTTFANQSHLFTPLLTSGAIPTC